MMRSLLAFVVIGVALTSTTGVTGCATTGPPPAGAPGAAGPQGGQGVAAGQSAAGPAAPAPPPLTAEGCRACKGVWAVHGVASVESCNCRTTDGGKRCRDGADCQGMCIAAEEPDREVIEAGPPARGYFIGRCSDLVTVFGCNRLISRGAASKGPTSLAELPSSLCVD